VQKTFVKELPGMIGKEVVLKGWIHRYRPTSRTVFIILQDASGTAQVVSGHTELKGLSLKTEDCIEVIGRVRADDRARQGFEVDLLRVSLLNNASQDLPFVSGSDLTGVGPDVVLDHRPLSLRTYQGGTIFRVQAALVEGFRAALRKRHFTEVFTSKIVAGGTEGGTNLFEIGYFGRSAYLAQSPQFYKEHGVCGLERVFETGHVYRAEPHATARHLAEYYSLDFEMGFIDGPLDVIETEREVLSEMFEDIARRFEGRLDGFDVYTPSLEHAPVWEFGECLDRLKLAHGRMDLDDDLDPEAERQLCALAETDTGVRAVFVHGFPMSKRPFYTMPVGDGSTSAGFDLLFRGVEVTTGGQRLHRREDLEAALKARGMEPGLFAAHLRMYDLGMPPHGGLAIGAERLTCQVLGLQNVRQATMYPRDQNRTTP